MSIDLDKLPAHPCGWDVPRVIQTCGGSEFISWMDSCLTAEDAEGLAASLLRAAAELKVKAK